MDLNATARQTIWTKVTFEFGCVQCHYHRCIKSNTYPRRVLLHMFVKEWIGLKSLMNLNVVL